MHTSAGTACFRNGDDHAPGLCACVPYRNLKIKENASSVNQRLWDINVCGTSVGRVGRVCRLSAGREATRWPATSGVRRFRVTQPPRSGGRCSPETQGKIVEKKGSKAA